MTAKEVDSLLGALTGEPLVEAWEKLLQSGEKLPKSTEDKYKRKIEREQKEQERLLKMWTEENALFETGAKVIAGVDEVGRGPLAGPVYAAAVILKPRAMIIGINDSKKLSPEKREALFEEIPKHSVSFALGSASVEEIDKLNIRAATHLAMARAVEALSVKPDYLLIDGEAVERIPIPQRALIKGDSRSISIAAASVMAKVTRDRLMDALAAEYPEYGFERNKGYGTKEHMDAILAHGIKEIHRKTFLTKFTAS